MRSGTILRAALAAALLLAGAASAQTTAAPPLDATERRATVEQAASALRGQYIYPDVGERAAAAIETALAAGAYDDLDDRRAFALRLTDDLRAVAHDKHLRVSSRSAPPPNPTGGPRPRSEGGIVRADRLADGIGYLEIMGFPPMEVFGPATDRAMAALADTKALIIDMRRNGGGNPASVSYLVSFFMPAKTHVNDLIWRNAGTTTFRTESFWTGPTPMSYLGKPVYLLTSSFTFSGGEEFVYDLKALKRATLVGEVTGGGANPGGMRPLGADLIAFVPAGRAENPITKTSWEGKGVAPDIATPAADALKVALERLGASPAAGDIEMLSQARLFAPRTTAQAGAEAALRARIPELVSGTPAYGQMTTNLADITRRQLPDLQKQLAALGALKSVAFREVDLVGGNVYDVTFESGAVRWTIVMTADGKVAVSFFQPS
jgi:hypothetical protein